MCEPDSTCLCGPAPLPDISPVPVPERLQNAGGKKLCGMCRFKMPGVWSCVDGFQCPNSSASCSVWAEKPSTPCPPQSKKESLQIPPGVKFIYIGRPRGKTRKGEAQHQGVVTVAYRVNQEAREVEIGFSSCSPSDNWNRERGREIALSRLEQMVIRAPYLYQPRRVAGEVAQALVTHDFQTVAQVCRAFPSSAVRRITPSWTRDLAKAMQPREITIRFHRGGLIQQSIAANHIRIGDIVRQEMDRLMKSGRVRGMR